MSFEQVKYDRTKYFMIRWQGLDILINKSYEDIEFLKREGIVYG